MPLFHKTNGLLYCGPKTNDVDAYKASIRRAYGSLRGVKVIVASDSELAYKLAFFGMGAVEVNQRTDGKPSGYARIV